MGLLLATFVVWALLQMSMEKIIRLEMLATRPTDPAVMSPSL